jgi:hypothetical protein
MAEEGLTREEWEAQVRAQAKVSDLDTEELLSRLLEVQSNRRGLESEYELLRSEGAEALEDGPRYFIGPDGCKWYATRGQASTLDIDEDALLAELDEALLDQVMPRKLNKTAFKEACETERISAATVARVARLKPNQPFVKFHRFESDDA